jgi:hypothetical protein
MDHLVNRAIDTLLGGTEARTMTRMRLETVLQALAHEVVRDTETSVLMSLLTAEDAADRLSITTRRVRAIARNRNARGIPIGWQVPGTSQWLFLPDEVELLRPGKPGRPRNAA